MTKEELRECVLVYSNHNRRFFGGRLFGELRAEEVQPHDRELAAIVAECEDAWGRFTAYCRKRSESM